eukprot:1160122-Pelagomonas_calceolata.AAC.3
MTARLGQTNSKQTFLHLWTRKSWKARMQLEGMLESVHAVVSCGASLGMRGFCSTYMLDRKLRGKGS